MKYLIVIAVVLASVRSYGQTCLTGGLPFYQIDGDAGNNTDQVDFVFDQMHEYLAGKTVNGATSVRVSVTDGDAVANCGWKLTMTLNNNGTANEGGFEVWEENFKYGSGVAGKPRIDILNVRVDNNCNTPADVGYRVLANPGTIGTALEIIDDGAAVNASGFCDGREVNAPGSATDATNYGEYTFIVDFRVTPTFNYQPGVYELSLNFVLEPR